jgi:geranylgeranyl reductase family
MHDVVVIGGGPAGSISAGLLAKDHDVTVIEEHRSSGVPVQCTGLVTQDAVEMSGMRLDILNKIYGANVFFPNGGKVHVRSKDVKAVLIDRENLDRRLAQRAEDAGANFLYGHSYKDHKVHCDKVVINVNGDEMESSMLIGADGQASRVARSISDNRPKEYVYGIQVDVRHRMDTEDMMNIHIGSEFAPGFFTWEIPFGDFTRVGLCSSVAGSPSSHLRRLMKEVGLDETKVISKYSGKIPLGGCRRTYGERLMTIGDAAGQVKPVSGGGIYPIMKAAPILKDVATEAITANDFSSKKLSLYEKGWKKEIGKELDRGYRIRKMYTNLSDKDLNKVFEIVNKDDIRAILNDIKIDSPSDVAPIILKNPRAAVKLLPIILRSLI